jgi:hypothetical protein
MRELATLGRSIGKTKRWRWWNEFIFVNLLVLRDRARRKRVRSADARIGRVEWVEIQRVRQETRLS